VAPHARGEPAAVAENRLPGVGAPVLFAGEALPTVHAARGGPANSDLLADLHPLGRPAHRRHAADDLVAEIFVAVCGSAISPSTSARLSAGENAPDVVMRRELATTL
jgi:hypothetical protein